MFLKMRTQERLRSIPIYVITVPERYGQTDDILCHNRALRSIAR